MRRILCQTLDRGDHCRVRMPDRRNDLVGWPASAQCLVERNKAVALKADDFGALLLQCELLPFGVENVQEVGQSAVITLGRDLGRLARCVDGEIKAADALPVSEIGGVGLVRLLDRNENRLPICHRKLVRTVVGNLDEGIERAEIEEGGANRRSHRTDPCDGNRGTGARATLGAAASRQRQGRKQVRGPGADRCDRRGQQALRLDNVRPPTQEIDGKPDRCPRRQPWDRTRSSQFPIDGLRILSDQDGDGIAVGRYQRLERFDVCLQRLDLAFCKQRVQFVGEPAIQPGLGEIEHFA